MKVKIIDLFNKIANNEKVPKKIRYFGQIYEYSEEMKFYYQNGFSMYRDFFTKGNCLNDEVEIIEDKKEIKPITMCMTGIMGFDGVENITTTLKDKINELVDEVNKLKKEKN